MGSVFSPYYAWERRRGAAAAQDHCAVNVALYGPRAARWAMTERGADALSAAADALAIGRSVVRVDGNGLVVEIDEIAAPIPRRVRGVVRISFEIEARETFTLSENGGHVWRPIAPHARVEARFTHPALAWRGAGYVDHNRGAAPLEDGFRDWTWMRAPTRDGAVVLYDGLRRDGARFDLGLRFRADGAAERIEPPPAHALAPTLWRMKRTVRSDDAPRLVRTLEDAPFYARSAVAARIAGEDAVGVHESLSLDRFRLPLVQAMLPFRMPRRGRGALERSRPA